MAMKKTVPISFQFVGNGVDNTVVLDLAVDPYWVAGSFSPEPSGTKIANWFADERRNTLPTAATLLDTSQAPYVTLSLSGTVLTATYTSPITSGETIALDVLLQF